MTYDAAIVGAGIVGAACAASLSSAGLKVVVVDSNGIAAGTTAAGMGHIVVLDDSDAQFALTAYSQTLWHELAPALPVRCEFEQCGTIWLAADEMDMAEAGRKSVLFNSRGINAEMLDEKSLRSAEPNLRKGLAGGLLIDSDCVVYQLSATRFLLNKSIQKGAVVRVGLAVAEVTDFGVRLENGEAISAGTIINAAGTLAADLTPGLKIVKRKGHLVVTDRYPDFARHQLVELGYLRSAHGTDEDTVAFNVQPRSTGQVIVGSSRQSGVQDGKVDRTILKRMAARAFEFMPALKKLSTLRVWTGFRPATPDNLPYIGKLPHSENVYVAAGHEGFGITASLGTAELIADTILGRKPAIPMEPYDPARCFLP